MATTTERVGEWMFTFTGRQFWPFDPRAEEVAIDDVAHHLALICRWGGACRTHYSVAQHSVLVARQVPLHLWAAALLHDAAEAYLGDFIRPVKKGLCTRGDDGVVYRIGQAEDRILLKVFEAMGLAWPTAAEWGRIKAADNVLCATERRDLMPPHDRETLNAEEREYACLHQTIVPLPIQEAEMQFLKNWEAARVACRG